MLFYVNFTFVDINIELRHNVPTSQRSNIEQERVTNPKLGQSTFCIWRLPSFVAVFSLRKDYRNLPLCQNCTKSQSAKSGKYHQQTVQDFNKSALCRNRCPLRHPTPSLRHWCSGVYIQIFNPGQSNPTTFQQLRCAGDTGVPNGRLTFNSKEKALTCTIYWLYSEISIQKCDASSKFYVRWYKF